MEFSSEYLLKSSFINKIKSIFLTVLNYILYHFNCSIFYIDITDIKGQKQKHF